MSILQQALHHFGHTVALTLGLEVDQKTAAVEGIVGAVHPDEGRQAGDIGILQQLGGQLLLALRHGFERHGRPSFGAGAAPSRG